MRNLLKSVLLALIIIFFIALSTYAMSHSASYNIEGAIYSTSAGNLTDQKEVGAWWVIMPSGKTDITFNDIALYESSIAEVAIWELCAPPRYTYTSEDGSEVEVSPDDLYKSRVNFAHQESSELVASTWAELF
jgi:hypothetical protein